MLSYLLRSDEVPWGMDAIRRGIILTRRAELAVGGSRRPLPAESHLPRAFVQRNGSVHTVSWTRTGGTSLPMVPVRYDKVT